MTRPIGFSCLSQNETLLLLIEVGGHELLMIRNLCGDIALHDYFSSHLNFDEDSYDSFACLLKECILANVGGEFGIGGLFNTASDEVQDKIYKEWEQISPVLESTMISLQDKKYPILHAAILAKAPPYVIHDIINQFECSVLRVDSLNRYPIEVAVKEGLEWNRGMKEIVEATSAAQQQHSSIYAAAQYGIKWDNHMKQLTESNVDEIMNGYNRLTGLRLFMVAAMGDCYDLSGIYGMMKMSPKISNCFYESESKRRRLD